MESGTPRAKTRTPRTGRRPGVSSSRAAILEAARKLFLERGFQGATMRAIAAEAGVDASLVVHFFGNKLALFNEAVGWPWDPEVALSQLLSEGRRNVGRNLATLFVTTWEREGSRSPILTLLAAAVVEPEAAAILREWTRDKILAPLLKRLGSDQPELRANLVGSQLLGLGMARYVLEFEPIASAKPADVVDWVAPNLQRHLTAKL